MKKLLSLLFVATFAVTAHAIDNHAAADAA